MKRTLITVAVTVASTLAVTAATVALAFSIRPAGDGDLLLLRHDQAKECEEGGGCAVFSEREFKMAVMGILRQMQVQQQRSGTGT